MNDRIIGFPAQRITYKEKVSNDYEWVKDTAKSIVRYLSDSGPGKTFADEYQRMWRNYRWYNSEVDQKEFESECNVFGLDVDQIKDEVLPFSKVPNKINTLLGEELSRPFTYKTVLVNSDGIKSKLKLKDKMIKSYFESKLMETINEYAQIMPPKEGEEPEPLMAPEEVEEYFSTKYRDIREHYADQVLNYLLYRDKLKQKKNDAFSHGLKSGYEIVKVGIKNGMPTAEVINPMNFFWHKSPEVKYIQDALFAGQTKYMTIGEVLDEYSEDLTEEDIESLEGKRIGGELSGDMIMPKGGALDKIFREVNFGRTGSYGISRNENDISVTHVEWRSQKKIGFLTFLNDDGEEETTMLNEDFVVPKYAEKVRDGDKVIYLFDEMKFEWGWIPEIWECTIINSSIYVRMGPRKYQYRSVDDPYNVKLSYHGVIYSAMNSNPISLMDRLIPFDKLYMLTFHKLKNLIAKDRGQIFHFDLSMVDPKIGLEKTLYYLNELDIDLYNPLQNASQPGAYQRGKVTGATNRSNMQHIGGYIQLLAALDEHLSDLAGITRQREGWIGSQEAVSNSRESIVRSAVITEAVYFLPHEALWEDVLNSLVQVAQVAFRDKKIIKQYVMDDASVAAMEVEPDEFFNADFGVFVSNAAKDREVFDYLKMYGQALVQNDKISTKELLEIAKATSIRTLEKAIQNGEKERRKQIMEQIQAQQQAEQQRMQQEAQLKVLLQDSANQTRILSEQIKAEAQIKEQEMEDETDIEVTKMKTESAEEIAEINAKSRNKGNRGD